MRLAFALLIIGCMFSSLGIIGAIASLILWGMSLINVLWLPVLMTVCLIVDMGTLILNVLDLCR